MNDSFKSVMAFIEAHWKDDRISYYDKHNVVVNNTMLFKSIDIHIYEASYGLHSCYKVDIIWEDDDSHDEYHSLGLHGTYSSDYQDFVFVNNSLSFEDGDNKITILG